MKKLIPQKIKNIYHLGVAITASFFHGRPGKKIKVIGVTGTNGKTTTVQMIARILEEAGYKVAVASTINFKINEEEFVNKTKFTTLSSWGLQKFLKKALEKKCQYAVLEISSHALDQNRTWGINFDTAVITNITREHLDYHKNMENYRLAKLKLFQSASCVVVNLDMENAKDFLDCGNKKIKYGYSAKEDFDLEKFGCGKDLDCGLIKVVKAENINLALDSSLFTLEKENFRLNLSGVYNIENALASIATGMSQEISIKKMSEALEKIKNISGRMERVSNDLGIDIIIDYAVTPDSLQKMYSVVKNSRKEGTKIIAIGGACGERDRGKRPIMGKIISESADYVIITNEDPYGEDPMQIINEVFEGVTGKTEGGSCWKIPDRRKAIKKALALAKPGDIFVITGKGAEEIMAVGKERIPWNDRRVILEELKNI